jgi:hypothetical protein
VRPEKQAAVIKAKPLPVQNRSPKARKEPFFTIVRDEVDDSHLEFVVLAEDDEEAGREGVQRRKDAHQITDPDDDSGFKAVAVFTHEDLSRILRKMELFAPDV